MSIFMGHQTKLHVEPEQDVTGHARYRLNTDMELISSVGHVGSAETAMVHVGPTPSPNISTVPVGHVGSAETAMVHVGPTPSPNISTVPVGYWSHWIPVGLSTVQFQCRRTLTNGQSFAWSYHEHDHVFTGVIGQFVYRIQQRPESPAQFCVALRSDADSKAQLAKAETVLRDYLHSFIDLDQLYRQWEGCDKRFAEIAKSFDGVRLLRQDPVECLFSFICSSNNHIGRITMMLTRLREMYGQPIVEVDGVIFRAFPAISSLARVKESELRELGFGYRAKFIKQTASILHEERPVGFLDSLRGKSIDEIRMELCNFAGVGRKVADCVALFSLDQHHVVPVDTHVVQIAMKHYRHHLTGIKLTSKSLSDKVYGQISSMFTDVFGERAGWAHSILFTSDLTMFKTTADVISRKRRRL